MSKRKISLAFVGFLALAACGKKDEVKLENATAAEVQDATKSSTVAESFRAGQWRTSSELVSVEMEGLPKAVADQMGKQITEGSTFEYCMTPEEAKKPNDAFTKNNGECTYESFSMSGGKVDAKVRCTPKGSSSQMTMTMNGDYQPERYEVSAEMKIVQPELQGKELTMKLKTKSERIGDCKA